MSQRAKLLVSVSASLQNSEPVQATVPRAKSEALHRQARGGQFRGDQRRAFLAHIHDQQILHHGVAHVAVGIAVGEVGGEAQVAAA